MGRPPKVPRHIQPQPPQPTSDTVPQSSVSGPHPPPPPQCTQSATLEVARLLRDNEKLTQLVAQSQRQLVIQSTSGVSQSDKPTQDSLGTDDELVNCREYATRAGDWSCRRNFIFRSTIAPCSNAPATSGAAHTTGQPDLSSP